MAAAEKSPICSAGYIVDFLSISASGKNLVFASKKLAIGEFLRVTLVVSSYISVASRDPCPVASSWATSRRSKGLSCRPRVPASGP